MKLVAILLASLLVACSAQPQPSTQYPEGEVEGKLYCAKACENATKLSCKFAKPSPNGRTCQQVCEKYTPPNPVGVRPKCMSEAKTCKELDDVCVY